MPWFLQRESEKSLLWFGQEPAGGCRIWVLRSIPRRTTANQKIHLKFKVGTTPSRFSLSPPTKSLKSQNRPSQASETIPAATIDINRFSPYGGQCDNRQSMGSIKDQALTCHVNSKQIDIIIPPFESVLEDIAFYVFCLLTSDRSSQKPNRVPKK